jgi:hypothetical protein
MNVNKMKEGGCEKEAGRTNFTIETVEMKGHCSAQKTIHESREKYSIETKCFIVKELNGVRGGVSVDQYCCRAFACTSVLKRSHLLTSARAVLPDVSRVYHGVTVSTAHFSVEVLCIQPTQFIFASRLTLIVTVDYFPKQY